MKCILIEPYPETLKNHLNKLNIDIMSIIYEYIGVSFNELINLRLLSRLFNESFVIFTFEQDIQKLKKCLTGCHNFLPTHFFIFSNYFRARSLNIGSILLLKS